MKPCTEALENLPSLLSHKCPLFLSRLFTSVHATALTPRMLPGSTGRFPGWIILETQVKLLLIVLSQSCHLLLPPVSRLTAQFVSLTHVLQIIPVLSDQVQPLPAEAPLTVPPASSVLPEFLMKPTTKEETAGVLPVFYSSMFSHT